jgi:hypothetical protein
MLGFVKAGNILNSSLQLQVVECALEGDRPDCCLQMSENEVVELSAPVMSVDSQRLQVLTRNAEGKLLSLLSSSSSSHLHFSRCVLYLFSWCPLNYLFSILTLYDLTHKFTHCWFLNFLSLFYSFSSLSAPSFHFHILFISSYRIFQ